MTAERNVLRARCCEITRWSCLALVLAGCAVGPDFSQPGPPEVEEYTSAPMPAVLTSGHGEEEQRLLTGQTISAEWWALFESPALKQIIEEAIARNHTLAAAKATLAQAQQVVLQARGAYYPQLDFAANAQRQQASNSLSERQGSGKSSNSPPFNLFSLGPTVSYTPDVFGATRRLVEQQEALAENQAYQLAAAYLTLTGNAVSQTINVASARMQLSAAEDIITQDERDVDLVRRKFEAGKAAESDVLTAQSLLENDRTQIPPLRQQLSVARHALSVLVGRFPGEWSPPDLDLTDLKLPQELPLSLPSEVARQRPDILAAEAQLHAASAEIGVAVAQMYPTITLSASAGFESSSVNDLFQASSLIWGLASGLSAPIFHGGTLEAQKQAAIEAFRASLATYQQTVLEAFGQIADTLRALQHDAELVDAERSAYETSSASLALQRLIYEAGKSDLLLLLTAERAYQQARLGYVRAQAQRLLDTAQLFVALGGGWWEASERIGVPMPEARPWQEPTGGQDAAR
jgi:NodT family efflux transporter outer membrane factor (OMF) lipoprotein